MSARRTLEARMMRRRNVRWDLRRHSHALNVGIAGLRLLQIAWLARTLALAAWARPLNRRLGRGDDGH